MQGVLKEKDLPIMRFKVFFIGSGGGGKKHPLPPCPTGTDGLVEMRW